MELHMWKLVVDSRALTDFARSQNLLHRDTDHGYVMHAALAAMLGEAAPAPFVFESALAPSDVGGDASAVRARPQQVVLAYSPHALEVARAMVPSELEHLVVWDDSASKVVPAVGEGRVVGFTTRVVPVVRTRAAGEGHPSHGRGAGRELDAFLAECARVGRDVRVDRAAVYREWLAQRMCSGAETSFGGATLEDFSLVAFQRVRLLRKGTASGARRARHVVERPDALVSGTLRVADARAFAELLARGVGRHRAFGFGMLLLRSVSRSV